MANRLFRNAPPGPILIGALLIVFVGALATKCRAEDIPSGGDDGAIPVRAVTHSAILADADASGNGGFSERRGIRVDVESGFTILRARTPAIALNVTFQDVAAAAGRDFDIQVGVGVIGEYRYKGRLESNQLYFHALLVDGFGKLDLGVGGVYLQNTDQINGSNANFSLLVGYRFTDRVSANWRHFSNAGTALPNLGRDFVNLVISF